MEFNEKSDVYSLAMTIWYAMEKTKPYHELDSKSNMEFISQVLFLAFHETYKYVRWCGKNTDRSFLQHGREGSKNLLKAVGR